MTSQSDISTLDATDEQLLALLREDARMPLAIYTYTVLRDASA